jgi:hypothetical protein
MDAALENRFALRVLSRIREMGGAWWDAVTRTHPEKQPSLHKEGTGKERKPGASRGI